MLSVIIVVIAIAFMDHFFNKCIHAYSLLSVKREMDERDTVLPQKSTLSSVGDWRLQDRVMSTVVGKAHRMLWEYRGGGQFSSLGLCRNFLEEVSPYLSLERETKLLDKTKNGSSAK